MKRVIISLLAALCWLGCQAALPEVTLQDMDGKQIAVSSLAGKGKPVIISFFATWCKPCMRELKAISDLYPEWQEETGVEMYIVSIDQAQDIKKVRPLVDGNGWEYHVLLDPNGTLKRAMNVQNVPHLFILDRKGTIVYQQTGYTDGEEIEIGSKIYDCAK